MEYVNNDDKVIEPLLPTLDYSELKPTFLRTNIKPTYETKLRLKYLDEAIGPAQHNFTRSVVINKKNDTIHNNKPGLKLKVKISKKDNDHGKTKHNDNIPTQYTIANNNNKHTTKNLYPEIKGEKKNDTENLPKRSVPGFNIENKSDVHFKANTEYTIENENVRFLPIQYHVPVLGQFQINQVPLPPPILPPRHTLPKFIPVYQSDNLPLHFYAPDPMYSSHLDTISKGISPQNQFNNLEKYFKLHDSNQHSESKGLEKGVFDGEDVKSYIYEQYGIPISKGHSVVERQVKVNPIKNSYIAIDDTRRGIVNRNEEYLDARIKIPKYVVEHYQPQMIDTLKYNIDNNTIKDFTSIFSQVQGNVSYRKAEDLKAERDLHVTNSTDTFGIDTLIKQYIMDPKLAKEQTENVFPKLISILGPEFSRYFGENPIPAGKIDNEINKLQNTLETLKKLSEFSKNITPNKTQRETTGLPIVNRTYLTESVFIESHLNNKTQTRNARSQTQRYKTATNEHVTSKAPTLRSTKFLNTFNNPPKIATTHVEMDITTKHVKTTTLEPDNKSYKPLQLQINKDDLELQDDSGFIQNKKATFDEIKKTLDKFTMERKKTITSTPRHLEIEAYEEIEKKVGDAIQPHRVKNIDQKWTSIPNLDLIGKVLNENYILLSQQSNKNKTTSRLPETIELQSNSDEDIVDPKYISENPEVLDSLRQQTEIMGKLLLNYKKHSARDKNKGDNQQSKDNNMKDFEVLINNLEEGFQAKSTTNREISTTNTIKKINNTKNSHSLTKIANNNEKSRNKKITHSRDSIESKKSSIEPGAWEVKPTKHNKDKLTKEIYSKEIATEGDDQETSPESDGEEIATEGSSKETSSKEISSNKENVVSQPTKASKNQTHMSRFKNTLLRNPDLLKILRYCKSHKRNNKSGKRNF